MIIDLLFLDNDYKIVNETKWEFSLKTVTKI